MANNYMKQFLDFKKLLDFYKNKQLLVFGYGSFILHRDYIGELPKEQLS